MFLRFIVNEFCQISVKVEHLNVQDVISLKGIFSSRCYKYKDHVQDSLRTRLMLIVIILLLCDNPALASLSHVSGGVG